MLESGVDILEIARIDALIQKNPRFLQRFFTENERELFEKRQNRVETIAGSFAVKEAVSKVFGTGIRGFEFRDIEVLRDALGKPYVVLHNDALALFNSKGFGALSVSISHSKNLAIAFAVALKG
ncbi:holo-ACP synthase [Fusibacter tunisiensis]|uniref:Holo-[acyl-carrier-protein] synthase n=1 Tax=Fusibacter tunisiensis TaxID=1008308 RepID=A0ABS2MRD2_9FIRM|nr:holo-ACP synthase [Fusibacter tunisiensis]MBM7561927.1 holo-[acyl-carrier-protein] synthase [Fusibacter tunisiensis]